MKKLVFILLGVMMASPVWAEGDLSNMLDKVSLHLNAEKWITTQTAEVNVSVNAGVSDAGIEKIQAQVLDKLEKLSNLGEWHIVSFSRREDKSGLETVQIAAQARLPQLALANLRGKAKSISKPGETYTIDAVRFTPSEEEMAQAQKLLRGMIYSQVKTEVATLNKTYPGQVFSLYRVDFNMNPAPMMAMMAQRSAKVAASPPPLNIGNKLTIQASVVLAAMPDMLVPKKSPLIHP
tara:strand:- start:936 stop:1643 length:708 start_codon:yes stop_codon:yes gene_type:complete